MKTYRGKTWDDLMLSAELWTGGRTITEHDLQTFSGLTGDYNPLHTDEEFSRAFSPFESRIPHGPMVHDLYLGLLDRVGILQGTALAMLELRCKFLAPARIGDTIHARIVVKDKTPTKQADRGIVVFAVTLFNQSNVVVQEIEHVFLLRRS